MKILLICYKIQGIINLFCHKLAIQNNFNKKYLGPSKLISFNQLLKWVYAQKIIYQNITLPVKILILKHKIMVVT